MKGLVLLFLAIVFAGIGWSYCSKESRQEAVKLVKRHLLVIIFGWLAVAVAIFLSVNTTLRLV
jgi:uncharacterized membrane protein